MKDAQSWTEEVAFVECPYCDFSHSLGDAHVYEDYESLCESCGKTFKVLASK